MSWVDWCRNDRCDTFQQSHRGSVQAGCSVAFSESPWELSTAAQRAEMWEVHFPRLPRSSLTAAFPTIIQKCELLLKKLIHKPVHLPFPAVFAARGAGQGLTLCVSRFCEMPVKKMKRLEGLWGPSSAETKEWEGCRSSALCADITHLQARHFMWLAGSPGERRAGDRRRKGVHSGVLVLLPQRRVSLWVSAWLMSPRLPWAPLAGTSRINTAMRSRSAAPWSRPL